MFSFSPPRAYLEGVALDCSGEIAFVSHAHADHAARAKKTIASDETIELLKARGYPVGERHHNGFSLLEAGHVLGSRMLLAEKNGMRALYAPDFRTDDGFTTKAAHPVECDELLVGTTFGSPEYVFPERREVYAEIQRWVAAEQEKGIVVLGGYALGKAQELIACLNEGGVAPLVNDDVARVSEVYRRHGVPLDYITPDSAEGESELGRNFVAVLPFNKVNSVLAGNLWRLYGKMVHIALATGWAGRRPLDADRVFCLSDHCDYPHLLEFVEATGAKKVYTTHGFDVAFARELQERGIGAQPAFGWF